MAAATFREQFSAALRSRNPGFEYTSHLKVYEFADDKVPSSFKTRYLLLAQTSDRKSAMLFKAKRNANGSFSIGKEWDAALVRELELQPDMFVKITLARSYRWQADKNQDLVGFLETVRAAVKDISGDAPNCVGWEPKTNTARSFGEPSSTFPAHVSSITPSTSQTIPQLAPVAASPSKNSAEPSTPLGPSALDLSAVSPHQSMTKVASPQRSTAQTVVESPITRMKAQQDQAFSATRLSPAPLSSKASPSRSIPSDISDFKTSVSPNDGYSKQTDLAHPDFALLNPALEGVVSSKTDIAGLTDKGLPGKSGGRLDRPAITIPPSTSDVSALRRQGVKENATLTHVEEMLEGFEWKASTLSFGSRSSHHKTGTADVIESRLMEELSALESSNIHAMIESDDRVLQILQSMDGALGYLDQLDANISNYKRELNARADDIAFIESQNRGLQVQTSNQRVLLQEIEAMIASDNLDHDTLSKLANVNVNAATDISQIELAATTLYKGILQTRPDRRMHQPSTDLNAMVQRLSQYESIANQFCSRMVGGAAMEFEREVRETLADSVELQQISAPNATVPHHRRLEQTAGKYCGLMLFMREMSSRFFEQLSNVYLQNAAALYQIELQRVFQAWRQQLSDNKIEQDRGSSMERAGVSKNVQSTTPPWEAMQRIYASVIARLQDEQAFMSDLLHINNSNLTFADYMDLEPHYRHRAVITSTVSANDSGADMTNVLSQMFAALMSELDNFVLAVGRLDRILVVGILSETERVVRASVPHAISEFLKHSLSRALSHMQTELARLVNDHIQAIEQTKLSVKKRSGIVPFVRTFLDLSRRLEAQLVDADDLPVRMATNDGYERIGRAIFMTLQSVPSMAAAGGDEDKNQLNHQIILIENMYYVQTRIKPGMPPNPALAQILDQAQSVFEFALNGYLQSVLRRSLGKMMTFCGGIESLLQTTPANEITLHGTYSKSAAKKLVREYSAKDIRKAIEALSKRVQKHFNDEDESSSSSQSEGFDRDEVAKVLAYVWQACESNFLKEIERLLRILKICYADALQTDYSIQELHRTFQLNQPRARRR
ncbi:hypothetical protein MYAM1_000923 [Malassezia yamatoensis]|uniref:Exocyst complex component Sec3 PIP2-binding N-terminal domain-containing protein n=1 Tax=Malassezia yamatoensis TaxID=253288 RepID=A0AAJ5YXD5_9BASI|nr:hypothetical protein MYAM1_000923 [Malassezia yamatoensis]